MNGHNFYTVNVVENKMDTTSKIERHPQTRTDTNTHAGWQKLSSLQLKMMQSEIQVVRVNGLHAAAVLHGLVTLI